MTSNKTLFIAAFATAAVILLGLLLWNHRRAEEAVRERQKLEQTQRELDGAREALEQSRDRLAQSREKLAQSREELEQSRERFVDSREKLEQSRVELNRSVEDAEERTETLNGAVQASRDYEAEQRRKAARARGFFTGLSQAGSIKVAMAEYYQEQGRWPTSNSDLQLPKPTQYSNEGVYEVGIKPQGQIHIVVNDDGQRAKLILYGTASPTGLVNWRCVSPTTADIKDIVSTCSYPD